MPRPKQMTPAAGKGGMGAGESEVGDGDQGGVEGEWPSWRRPMRQPSP